MHDFSLSFHDNPIREIIFFHLSLEDQLRRYNYTPTLNGTRNGWYTSKNLPYPTEETDKGGNSLK
jgi:hypothetical protein